MKLWSTIDDGISLVSMQGGEDDHLDGVMCTLKGHCVGVMGTGVFVPRKQMRELLASVQGKAASMTW